MLNTAHLDCYKLDPENIAHAARRGERERERESETDRKKIRKIKKHKKKSKGSVPLSHCRRHHFRPPWSPKTKTKKAKGNTEKPSMAIE